MPFNRYARRVDANHAEIVVALRAACYSVLSLAAMGRGVPDLLVARDGRAWLVEVKKRNARGRTSAGAARSEREQAVWAASWGGCPVVQVSTVDEALRAVGAA